MRPNSFSSHLDSWCSEGVGAHHANFSSPCPQQHIGLDRTCHVVRTVTRARQPRTEWMATLVTSSGHLHEPRIVVCDVRNAICPKECFLWAQTRFDSSGSGQSPHWHLSRLSMSAGCGRGSATCFGAIRCRFGAQQTYWTFGHTCFSTDGPPRPSPEMQLVALSLFSGLGRMERDCVMDKDRDRDRNKQRQTGRTRERDRQKRKRDTKRTR